MLGQLLLVPCVLKDMVRVKLRGKSRHISQFKYGVFVMVRLVNAITMVAERHIDRLVFVMVISIIGTFNS